MVRTCLLDMDGVLADFCGGVFKLRGETPSPVTSWDWVRNDEWALMGREFWRNLPVMPEAFAIVEAALVRFGSANVAVLSSPVATAGCVEGKKAWLRRHFPILEGNAFFGKEKHLFASPLHLLVDDYDSNIEKFKAAGGHTILVPADYNARAGQPTRSVAWELRTFKD